MFCCTWAAALLSIKAGSFIQSQAYRIFQIHQVCTSPIYSNNHFPLHRTVTMSSTGGNPQSPNTPVHPEEDVPDTFRKREWRPVKDDNSPNKQGNSHHFSILQNVFTCSNEKNNNFVAPLQVPQERKARAVVPNERTELILQSETIA